MSASLPGSSIWLIETSTSGGIFLLSLIYCSNCATTVRANASISWCVPGFSAIDFRVRLKKGLVLGEAHDASTLPAFDEDLYRAVGQLQQLQHRPDRADGEDVGGGRIVLRRVLLSDQKNLLIVLHHVFERPHRFLAPHEKRNDHVRKYDDVAERQDRIKRSARGFEHRPSFSLPGAARRRAGGR